ncbi:MAG TPA: AbrB/MazE/SpoVT family DNA-binding domain-containing protein [Gemmatimonadaceae bacterium]|nr:AbrB/MazE/SpoVT family DNA-binding domain-containing protein [Gemmatimonadaceae bacterium]
MAKVTGKFQVTLPKALVTRCGIRVGDDLDVRLAGSSIQMEKRSASDAAPQRQDRLAQFDRATSRHKARGAAGSMPRARSRGWTREELYVRGRTR